MSDKKKLYEGKAKILYEGSELGTIIQHFKDDATAFNAQKKGTIASKGIINNKITAKIMSCLEDIGIPTHFLSLLNDREQLVRKVDIIPLEVIVRNKVAGSMARKFGLQSGLSLERPLVEFSLKNDKLGDPLIAEEHIISLKMVTEEELDDIFHISHQINDFLRGFFMAINLELVDFKIEFGHFYHQKEQEKVLLLADEFSPDNCRLWDLTTGDKLDKDRFRENLGGEVEAYREVAGRMGIALD